MQSIPTGHQLYVDSYGTLHTHGQPEPYAYSYETSSNKEVLPNRHTSRPGQACECQDCVCPTRGGGRCACGLRWWQWAMMAMAIVLAIGLAFGLAYGLEWKQAAPNPAPLSCTANPALCVNGNCVGGTCQCATGYFGIKCDQMTDPCIGNTCVAARGTCLPSPTGVGYICQCLTGFTGVNCEIEGGTDPCASHQCVPNQGTCISLGTNYYCQCIVGYTGDYCETAPADVCANHQCVNGVCNPQGTPYTCDCNTGYTGTYCTTQGTDPCANHGCIVDQGSCAPSTIEASGYICNCNPGFSGSFCEVYVAAADPCSNHQCVTNQGTCTVNGTGYYCTCVPGYGDTYCQTVVNACLVSHQCVADQGTCVPAGTAYNCSCNPGFSGTYCQIVDVCFSVNCSGHGLCQAAGTGYTCVCDPGYTGTNCETTCQPCASITCSGRGTCAANGCDFICTCNTPFEGRECQYDNGCTYLNANGNTAETVNPFNHYTLSGNGPITDMEFHIHTENGYKSIAALRVQYGSVWSAWVGDYQPSNPLRTIESLNLAPGEIVTQINGQWGQDGALGGKDKITELTITTDQRTLGPFGGAPSANAQSFIQMGRELLYIQGVQNLGLLSLQTTWACP